MSSLPHVYIPNNNNFGFRIASTQPSLAAVVAAIHTLLWGLSVPQRGLERVIDTQLRSDASQERSSAVYAGAFAKQLTEATVPSAAAHEQRSTSLPCARLFYCRKANTS